MPPSIADQVEDFFDDIKDAFGGNHRQLDMQSLATAHDWHYTKRKHILKAPISLFSSTEYARA